MDNLMIPTNPRFQNLAGQVFGRWTVLSYAGKQHDRVSWNCRCECGNTGIVLSVNLKHSKSKSCGCFSVDSTRARSKTHGLTETPEYNTWLHIHSRCYKTSNHAYPNYGGRGIGVCEQWHRFENFVADMGLRPSDQHSIDRIDNAGNYSPDNCRLATSKEQNNNKRSNVFYTHNGFTLSAAKWAEQIGCNPSTIRRRLYLGWSLERAITTPINGSRRSVNRVA